MNKTLCMKRPSTILIRHRDTNWHCIKVSSTSQLLNCCIWLVWGRGGHYFNNLVESHPWQYWYINYSHISKHLPCSMQSFTVTEKCTTFQNKKEYLRQTHWWIWIPFTYCESQSLCKEIDLQHMVKDKAEYQNCHNP